MKYWTLYCVLLLTVKSYAQHDSALLPPPPAPSIAEHNNVAKCVYKLKYTKHNFRSVFPFNLATTIKLISFKIVDKKAWVRSIIKYHEYEGLDAKWVTDSITIDTKDWHEVRTVTSEKKYSLADVLYNFQFNTDPGVIMEASCYMPKNAIVFYDSSSKIIAALELCFECHKMRAYPENIEFGDNCVNKLDLLKNFFKMNGVKYGVVN